MEPVISCDRRTAYEPYVLDDPSLAFATTSSGYVGMRFTAGSPARRPTTCLQSLIDTDTWQ